MEKGLHQLVRERAEFCCEYCHFPEAYAELPFHVDHIIARQHGGTTTPDNLAFACCHCNFRKGPNVAGVDPNSGRVVRLFHPRQHVWREHLYWQGPRLFGRTASGRATIDLLQINRVDAVAVRELLMQQGRFAPRPGRVQEVRRLASLILMA
jgi:hypothetical protein